jgi:hypothetical protein
MIPSISLERDYETSTKLQEIIHRGVFKDTTIQGPDGNPMEISPSYKDGKYNINIIWNGKEYLPEDIYKYELLNTGIRYLNRSKSLSQKAKQE